MHLGARALKVAISSFSRAYGEQGKLSPAFSQCRRFCVRRNNLKLVEESFVTDESTYTTLIVCVAESRPGQRCLGILMTSLTVLYALLLRSPSLSADSRPAFELRTTVSTDALAYGTGART
ncbi:hypothetical protein GY45DRAFT_694000 [Cubamyces sp. BRFM 1775]|nr:hypothetical protein GY45DRAFT_694000 [Cubamyces sp. BRFM 1775]